MKPRKGSKTKRSAQLVLAVGTAYLLAAYLAAPDWWRHHEHQPGLRAKPMVTTTPADIPGDPINIGLVASKNEVLSAFARSAWRPADAITLESSVEIGLSVLLREPYPNAPVSVLLFEGRVQDLAFEKTIGGSADQRHHVRLWRALNVGAEGRPVWLGTASLDRSVGISYYTGQITHHIAPDLDAERDMIMRQFEAAGVLLSTHLVSGIGPTTAGRNGGGDPYHTDGDVVIGVIAPDTEPQPDRVVVAAPVPISTAAKQQAWRFIRWLGVLDRLTKHPTRRESRNS